MSKSIVLSLLGAVALGSALLGGCGDADKKPATAASGPLSKAGESCARSADCDTGLVCFSNVCSTMPSSGDGGPTPVPLGGAGESCQRHSDCGTGLNCYNGICATAPAGDAGTGAQLGRRGESCQSAKDCEANLTCVPGPTGLISVCDVANFPPPEATGKMCAECSAPTDCCELPSTVESAETISSCSDLTAKLKTALGSATCANTADATAQHLCFIQSTYCNCASNTWDCQAGQCVYTASCKANGLVKQGCPVVSRVDRTFVNLGNCDTTASKCALPAGASSGCATDDDCSTGVAGGGAFVVFDSPPDTCSAGECKCVTPQGVCYRKCARDIDCPATYVCDTANSSLCVPQPQCNTDYDCAVQLHDVLAKCDSTKTCRQSCSTDYDCSGSGKTGGAFNGRVCQQGYCTLISCQDSNGCPAAGSNFDRREFCIDTPTGTTAPVYKSAITGGATN